MARFFFSKGYEVKGTTTTPEKKELLESEGIDPFLVKFDPLGKGEDIEDFFDCSILIINIPPSLRKQPQGFHIDQIRAVKEYIIHSAIQKIIYISSTSVYPAINKIFTEHNFEEFSHELIVAEEMIKSDSRRETTILRCGGLMGYDRIPGKYFSGKRDLAGGHNPVNYVHRDDVINVIHKIIETDTWNETFNLVAPIHPTKKEVCEKTCRDFNLPSPHFLEDEPENRRIISSGKLLEMLKYDFKYRDPLEFFYKMP